MKISPSPRRYLFPAACVAALIASYAFGYITNILTSDTPVQQVAQAQAAKQNGVGAGPANSDPTFGTRDRIGRQFADVGSASGSNLTLAQVTAGQPLEEWLKNLMKQDDEAFRLRHFMLLYDALQSPEDVKTALKALGGINGGRGGGRMEASLLLQKLTQLDPKEALAFAGEGRGGERFMATSMVVRTWAKTDPAAALAWAKANGAPAGAAPGASGAPNEGGEQRRGGPGGREGANENWLLSSVISQIAKTDPDKALAEASALKGRMSGRMTDAIAGEILQEKGAAAARQAAAALPEGDFKNEFIQQLTGKLAAQDPKATAAWVSTLPAGEAKSRALRDTVQQWLRKDAPAAGAFVTALPVAADSDSARSRYAADVAAKDQSAALATIKSITNPESQQRTVREIAGSLARRDPAAGQQFVAQTPLSDQAKADITRSLSRPQRNFGPGGPGGNRPTRGGGGPRQ